MCLYRKSGLRWILLLAGGLALAHPAASGPVLYHAPEAGQQGLSGVMQLYDRSHAVVIGINNYRTLPPLKGAVRDAQNAAAALKEIGMEVTTLIDDVATRAGITELLGDLLPNRVGENDRVLVYFAGHGVSVGEGEQAMGYLMPVEGDKERVRSSGISMQELQAWFADYPSKHVMFVADACYSGLALSTRAVGLSTRLPDYLRQVAAKPVRVALTAGGAGEQVHEWRGQGLFSYFFLEGIKGAADINGDGLVTSDELVAYIKPHVSQTAMAEFRRPQNPQMGRRGEGEFIFLNQGDVSFQINYVYRAGGTGPLMPITSGAVLHSGDHYKLLFTPDESAYVYIFQVDSSGQIFQLFPMEEFKGVRVNNFNPVRKSQRVVVPAPAKSFRLDEQTGAERLYFIASPERNEELERLYAELEQDRQQPKKPAAEDTQAKLKHFFQVGERRYKERGPLDIVTDRSLPVEWPESEAKPTEGQKAEPSDTFSVLERRLENICSGCVHVIEFEHR